MPFNNPLVGGLGQLIRQWIQSPDYVPNTSGWTINKDGTVEFTDGTFRGTITAGEIDGATISGGTVEGAEINGSILTVGAAPDPQIRLGTAPASDAGIIDFLPNDTNGRVGVGSLTQQVANDGQANVYGELALNGPSMGPPYNPGTGQTRLVLNSSDGSGNANFGVYFTDLVDGVNYHQRMVLDKDGIYLGGIMGGYYYEEIFLHNQTIASGAAYNALINLTSALVLGDFGSQFNLPTGVWTCPAQGLYSFTLVAAFTAWVSGSRILMAMGRGGLALANQFGALDYASTGARTMMHARKYMAKGDTVEFALGQVTGANQIIAQGEQSYISVQREL